MARFSEEKEKKIRLGCITPVFGSYIPEVMQGFLKAEENQNVAFELSCEPTPELVRRLKNGVYDILISSVTDDETVEQVLLYEQPLILLGPAAQMEDDLQDAADPQSVLTWNDLEQLPMIGYEEDSAMRALVNTIEEKEQIALHYAYCAPHEEAIASLVAHGFGYAIVPQVDSLSHYAVRCLPLPTSEYTQRIYLSSQKGIRLTGAAARFKQYLEKQYQN
jgi:DNA-binding transcriptional LysR family regulator